MEKLNGYMKEFVDAEHHNFQFRIGRHIASSLSGFIAGVVLSSIVWAILVYVLLLSK